MQEGGHGEYVACVTWGDSEHLLSNDSGDPPIVTADCAQLSSIIQKMGFVFGYISISADC